uniref:Dynein light chain n=1 Tax=Mycena chlorophos TaxID=658473 RepID=A0ABQ0LA35_MYCCL|nr:dynein light chain cytoplasmic [Mycena chlorophos]
MQTAADPRCAGHRASLALRREYKTRRFHLVTYLQLVHVPQVPWPRKSTRLPRPPMPNVDMSDEMQQESVDIASAALEKYNIEKDIAAQIKKEFDRRHGPTWHVVVGKNFGSYVTHETKHFIYFYVGSLAILIWKS